MWSACGTDRGEMVIFALHCRDAQDSDGVRRPTRLQSVRLPVRQLLLVHHLHRILQGQVSATIQHFQFFQSLLNG